MSHAAPILGGQPEEIFPSHPISARCQRSHPFWSQVPVKRFAAPETYGANASPFFQALKSSCAQASHKAPIGLSFREAGRKPVRSWLRQAAHSWINLYQAKACAKVEADSSTTSSSSAPTTRNQRSFSRCGGAPLNRKSLAVRHFTPARGGHRPDLLHKT